jgi:hypothetical protein
MCWMLCGHAGRGAIPGPFRDPLGGRKGPGPAPLAPLAWGCGRPPAWRGQRADGGSLCGRPGVRRGHLVCAVGGGGPWRRAWRSCRLRWLLPPPGTRSAGRTCTPTLVSSSLLSCGSAWPIHRALRPLWPSWPPPPASCRVGDDAARSAPPPAGAPGAPDGAGGSERDPAEDGQQGGLQGQSDPAVEEMRVLS